VDPESLETSIRELAETLELDAGDLEWEERDYAGTSFLEVRSDSPGSNGESEWMIFENSDDAREYALQYIQEMLRSDPEIYSLLEKHLIVLEEDKQAISDEEADSYLDQYEDDDEGALEEAKRRGYEGEDADEARDYMRKDYAKEIYKRLSDNPWEYAKELGYENFRDVKWLEVDSESFAEEVVDANGVGQTIDYYDGEEVELPSGAVAIGTN
jgi:hypothetical protein